MKNYESYHKQLFLQEVLEHLEDGILLCDNEFKMKFYNNKAALFLDIKADTSIDADLILKHVQESTQSFLNAVESFNYSTHTDPSIELEISTKPLLDEQKQFNGLLLILKEIETVNSKIKQAENDLTVYEFLLDHTSDGVILIDNNYRIIEANKKACTTYGISKEEFLTFNIFDLFPHQSKVETIKQWEKLMQDSFLTGFYKYKRIEDYVYIDFKVNANIVKGIHVVIFKNQTDHVILEKAYRQTESNLRTIFDNSAQSIFLFDQNDRLISFNKKAELYFNLLKIGFLKEGILFHTSGILPINSQVADEKISLIKENEILTDQFSITDSFTRELKWFEFTLIPFLNKKGNLISYCLTIQDITDRKIAEQNLFESEKKFRNLSENSPDIIYIIDLQKSRVTYFNRETILGYKSKSLERSDAWFDIVHPDDINRVMKHWADFILFNNKITGQIEYRLKDKDGQYQWVVNRHSVLDRDKNNSVLTVLLNITLITEQKESAEAIKNSQQRLNALVENTSDLIFSIDQKEMVTVFNSSFKNLLNEYFKIKIKPGDFLMKILPLEIAADWDSSIKESLKGIRVRKEVFFVLKNQPRYFDFSFSPIVTEENVVNGVSVMGRDITQRKQDEENIKRTNFELDSFVYKASHDLRAPLRSVLGLVNLAVEEQNEIDRKHYLSLVEKSINRLDTFIEDLTNFSRNSRLDLKITKINFKQIINECVDNLRFMDQKNPIEVKLDLDLKADFYNDSSRLFIVFQNILSNAIKYRNIRNSSSFIHLNIVSEKDKAVISVVDNGIGIMSEYLDKIFDMFFRASQDSYGSGLGLYITKQVVEKLGGTIQVESKYGEGTTFNISIPNLKNGNHKQ